jgi:hypothetical protein
MHSSAERAGSTGRFPVLLLLGRPASGKSEIIDYLQRQDYVLRQRLHVGRPVVLDDFPLLWAWFEEDDLLEKMGKPRLHTTPDGYFSFPHLWDVLIRRLCLEYDKLRAADPSLHADRTVVIEFSRGTEHGGYREAFEHLSDAVLEAASIVYVRVSYEESLRKNRRRFNPDRPHSILEHALPDEKLDRLYRRDDWEDLPRRADGSILVGGRSIPAAVFENEDDVTTPWRETKSAAALGGRLEVCLQKLWEARSLR